MNASIFMKPAKGLILASGLIAASSVMGYAQDAPVALGASATVPLSGLYMAPPTGITSLGGHSFDLSGGNLVTLANGKSASFTGSWLNAKGAYLLLNTQNTYWWYQGSIVGQVTLTFSDTTTQSVDLVVGGNIREWRTGAGFAVSTIADPTASQVWLGTAQPAQGGGSAVIDMLSISLTGTKTITGVTLSNTNAFGALTIALAGLTTDFTPPAPVVIPPTTSGNQTGDHQGQFGQTNPTTAPAATKPSASQSQTNNQQGDNRNRHGSN